MSPRSHRRHRASSFTVALGLACALLTACSDSAPQCDPAIPCGPDAVGEEPARPQRPVTYALTDEPYTALQQVWAPLEPSEMVRAEMDARTFTVYDHARYAEMGLGARLDDGIAHIERDELAPEFAEGTTRRSLAYLWIVADPQISDEESPIRMDGYDALYRPHAQLTPHTFEAHVRTAQRLSDLGGRPFDFALMAGDLTDSAQRNEIAWMITALNGGVIDPDSGMDNDPVPGPGNDYNDPFESHGIDAPWYAALGNHDVSYLGGFGLVGRRGCTPGIRSRCSAGRASSPAIHRRAMSSWTAPC